MSSTKELCEKNKKNIRNKKYPRFSSDLDYFVEYDKLEKVVFTNFPKKFKKSVKVSVENKFVEFYQDIDRESIRNTLKYLFYKIGGGQVFVVIKDNKLFKFIPFYNIHYRNDWAHKVEVDNIFKFLKKAKRSTRNVIKNKNFWRANGCLLKIRREFDLSDMGINIYKDLLTKMLKKRKVNDCYFFINKKDFPVLMNDGTEPYWQIYGKNVNLPTEYNFNKFVPILGMSYDSKSADIPIPTYEDWMVITRKYFPPQCKEPFKKVKAVPWRKKENKAFFRGSATGCGVTVEDNPRLKLSKISLTREDLDVGVTRRVNKLRLKNDKLVYTDLIRDGIPAAKFVPMDEQQKFKYIFDIEGNSIAFRLGYMLNSGSLILRVKSHWSLWLDQYLKECYDYVPIDSDFKKLDSVLDWCKKNDAACHQIAKNAKKAYKTYINKNFVFDYFADILNQISMNIV